MGGVISRYRSALGEGSLVWRDGLLVAHWLPGETGDIPGGDLPDASGEPAVAQKLVAGQLESFFSGTVVSFDLDDMPLGLDGISLFARQVYRALAMTRPGDLVSYAGLAAAAGFPGAARAVGSVMAANPWPVIVPCHRVVRSDGGLGGFSRGIAWKKRLLAIEGRWCGISGEKQPQLIG